MKFKTICDFPETDLEKKLVEEGAEFSCFFGSGKVYKTATERIFYDAQTDEVYKRIPLDKHELIQYNREIKE